MQFKKRSHPKRSDGEDRRRSWKISNKRMVQIEEDPQIGVKGNYKLSKALLLKLYEFGIFPLWEAASQEQRNAWSQGWLSMRTLNIQGILASGPD